MPGRSPTTPRRGTAAAELAILLPLLAFLFVASVDFARVYYYTLIVTFCARDGALYGCIDTAHSTDTSGIANAATADAGLLSPAPTVTSSTGTDSNGNPVVRVKVVYTFTTATSYFIPNLFDIPSSYAITRTVQMRVPPAVPS